MSGTTYRRSSLALPQPPVFNKTREKERFELSTLNDKFADYVEKVRYLEAQNRKIQMDSTYLQEKQQENGEKMQTLFEQEIAQLKQLAESLFNEKNLAFAKSQDVQNHIPPLKQLLTQTYQESDASKYDTDRLEKQLSSVEGDILMYKLRLAHQDNEHSQWKQCLSHIQRLLLQAKNEIHNENLARSSCEQTIIQIQTDILHLREQHQQKLKDLKHSSSTLNSNSGHDRASNFKSELSNAIRRIRQDFEKQNELHRNELYGQFTHSYEEISRQHPELIHLFSNEREQERLKQEEDRARSELQRVRSDSHSLKQKNSDLKLRTRELQINLEMSLEENKRLEQGQLNEINRFRLRHEKITKDYEDVTTKQTTLEKEIETYRNLLEGTMKPVVDHITEEYNALAANQAKVELRHPSSSSKRRSRLESADRTSSGSSIANKNDGTTTYVSSLTLNNRSRSTEPALVDSPRNFEESKTKRNDHDQQHTVEGNEPSNSPRQPIIIQTRRNN